MLYYFLSNIFLSFETRYASHTTCSCWLCDELSMNSSGVSYFKQTTFTHNNMPDLISSQWMVTNQTKLMHMPDFFTPANERRLIEDKHPIRRNHVGSSAASNGGYSTNVIAIKTRYRTNSFFCLALNAWKSVQHDECIDFFRDRQKAQRA